MDWLDSGGATTIHVHVDVDLPHDVPHLGGRGLGCAEARLRGEERTEHRGGYQGRTNSGSAPSVPLRSAF